MSNSLLKFSNVKRHSSGDKLYWSRAPEIGAPFRGKEVPALTEDEAEQFLIKVADAKVGFFRMTSRRGRRRFIEILDKIANGWYRLVYIKRFYKTNPAVHYIEWLEYYQQDGRQVKAITHNKEVEIA